MHSTQELYKHYLKHPKISTDSRKDVKDTIFFALRGDNFNGNKYAKSAIENGAKIAVIDDPSFMEGDQYFVVDDCLQALQELAIYHRKQHMIPLVAITGSNGKTTTKELIASVLETTHNIIFTKGNLNNHIGVPLSVLEIDDSTEIAIIEMGANHIGEIQNLCEIAQPDFGIITNIGKAHIEGFGSFEGVIQAKSELYDYINSKQGILFVNNDDDLLVKLADGTSQIHYGTNDKASLSGKLVSTQPVIELKWKYRDKEYRCTSNLYGSYNFYNIITAIAVGLKFNVNPKNINDGIRTYIPENNRSQRIKTTDNQIYLDAYNANPSSMEAAILNFIEQKAEHPWMILGDMFELGHISYYEHKRIIDLLKQLSISNVIFIGEEFYRLKEEHPFLFFKDTKSVKDYLSKNKIENSTILIKGSRGMELEQLVELL